MLAVFETEQQRSLARLVAAVDAAPDARAAVVAWIDENLALGFDSRRAARTRTLAVEGHRLHDEFPEHFDAIVVALLRPLIDAVTRGVADGTFPHAQPEQDKRASRMRSCGSSCTSASPERAPSRSPTPTPTRSASASARSRAAHDPAPAGRQRVLRRRVRDDAARPARRAPARPAARDCCRTRTSTRR